MHALLRAFHGRPDHPALRAAGVTWSYGQLGDRARRHAAGLRGLGLPAGARVAVLAEPAPALLVALLGQYLAGLVHVPINTRYRGLEVAHILRDSGAALVLVDQACAPALAEAIEQAPELAALPRILLGDELAGGLRAGDRRFEDLYTETGDALPRALPDDALSLMIYTSGTTGKSKGVAHTHRSVSAAIGALTGLWRWRDDDALVLALPLFHVHGLAIGVHGALLHGMTIELLPRFTCEGVIDAIAGGGTIFMGVPTMYRRLLDHVERAEGRDDAATLARARLFTSGSAALPAADFTRFEQLTGHRILERYGMSETLLTLSNPAEPARRVAGTVGFPVPGFEARVVDEQGVNIKDVEDAEDARGELWVRGVGLMREYWGNPQATAGAFADGGWFKTGDVVSRDREGRFAIVGRRSVDIIKSGGFKISARELEDALLELPEVAEVAVVGLPDPEWGQRIVAAVVPKTTAKTSAETSAKTSAETDAEADALAEAVTAHARARLASYKKPRGVAIVASLPRNALGKLQKHRLIAAIEAGELTLRAAG